jgi:hypothetical protein
MVEVRVMNAAHPSPSSLSRLVADLCRLRGDPQDFPYAPNLLALLVGAGVGLDVLTGYALQDAANTLGRSLLSSIVVLALCWVALAMRGLRNRYVQTAGALLACSVAFSLLEVPFALLYESPAKIGTISPASDVLLQFLVNWAVFGLFVWQIVVNAHIMRRAMDASFGFALMLVVTWLIAYLALEQILFGAA